MRVFVVAIAVSLGSSAALAQSGLQPVARVKIVHGDAQIVNRTPPEIVKVGDALYQGDVIATRKGALGFTMEDGTRISLGANAQVQVARFAYRPAENNLALVLRFLAGPIQYVSGVIARLAPDSVVIETPTATVAVRGTTFVAEVTPE